MNPPDAPNPDQPMVPTDDPGRCEAEYKAKGFLLMNLYVARFYPGLLEPGDHRQWICQFYRRRFPPNENYATGNCRNCDGQVKSLPLKLPAPTATFPLTPPGPGA